MDKYAQTLEKYFGFDQFREHQLDIIKYLVEKRSDVCVTMFTGAGKSLCYQFPAVHANKVVLVVSPLIALMNDQVMKMEALNIPTCALNSTVFNKTYTKQQILANEYRIVYTTPEYLTSEDDFMEELYQSGHLLMVCIDEAHTVSSWSQDFRPAYQKLSFIKETYPKFQC